PGERPGMSSLQQRLAELGAASSAPLPPPAPPPPANTDSAPGKLPVAKASRNGASENKIKRPPVARPLEDDSAAVVVGQADAANEAPDKGEALDEASPFA